MTIATHIKLYLLYHDDEHPPYQNLTTIKDL
jgi:hypothetical protein